MTAPAHVAMPAAAPVASRPATRSRGSALRIEGTLRTLGSMGLWLAMVLGLLPLPALAQLRFVTVVPAAANTSFPDEDGEYPAYIEIRSLETGILSGHYLTDNPNSPNKWQFPPGYALLPGQSIRVFASGKDRRPSGPGGTLHTSFTYNCNVPYCGLYNIQSALVHTFADRTDRCPCEGVQIFNQKTIVRTLIPLEDPGADWTLPGFDDSKWRRGVLGVGYEAGTSPYAEGLILYHTFDKPDVSSQVVNDVSGPTLHPGAIAGSLSLVAGRIDEGLSFKAEASNHVRVKHHPELDPGEGAFSASLWFRASRGGSATTVGALFTEYLLSKASVGVPGGPTQGPRGWAVVRTHTGTFLQAATPLGVRSISLGTTSAGTWNHVVMVVDRSFSLIAGYLNGKRIATVDLGSPSLEPIASDADLLEGRDPGGAFPFFGVLDDVALWRRALSDGQVQELYGVGLQGKSLLDSTAFPSASQMFGGLIGTDVLPQMKGIHTSAYLRVPFNLPSIPGIATGLRMRVHYTDGFVAYLNGVEVARRNAPSVVDYLAGAVSDRPDAAALAAEAFDLSPWAGLLKAGPNVLAFHGLSHHADAQRFLVAPVQLCIQVDRNPPQGGGECVRETNGREFWVAFPENYDQQADGPLRLRLCIAGAPGTHGLIDIPGLAFPGFPRPFTLPAAGTLVVDLPKAVELSGTDKIEPKGIHILATADVAVYGSTRIDFTTDTYLALPNKCLGTEYLVSTYRNVFSGVPVLNGTQFAIVAVANETEVTITPSSAAAGHPSQLPFAIKLNRGETYQLRNESGQPADLTGSRIVSSKPVAVFGSHRCANVQSLNQFFCDTVVEELLPIESWGTSFYVVPLATRASDTLRLLSASDQNLITLSTASGNDNLVLGKGEHKDLILDKPTRIISRGPLSVMQFANSSDADHVVNADPFMTLIQPSSTWLSEYRLCTPPSSEFERNFLNLVAPSSSILDATLINGVPLVAWDPARIVRGLLPGGAVFAKVEIDAGNSYHVVGRAPLGLVSYGFSEFDSYGHPGGMRFPGGTAPQIACPGEITLSCSTAPGTTAGCVVAVPDLTLKTEIFDECGSKRGVTVTQVPQPGTLLQPGTYSITLFASDPDGETAQCVTKLVITPSWPEQQFGVTIANNANLETTVWGANADPDEDGLPNGIEEALGSSPNQKTPLASLVKLAPESEGGSAFPMLISLPKMLEEAGPGLELEGMGSLEEGAWLAGDDIFELVPERTRRLPGGRLESVTFRVRQPISSVISNALFLRLKRSP